MINRIVTAFSLLICLLCFHTTGQAQIIKSRLDLVGGISYPEYLHGGIRYQYLEQAQLSLYYGGDIQFKPEIIRTWSINHMYHFGKHNFYSNRSVWYTRQGYTFATMTDEAYTYKISYLAVSAGYEFPLNNWIGINFDMGLNFKFYETSEYKDTHEQAGNPDVRWYPGFLARFQVYVSL